MSWSDIINGTTEAYQWAAVTVSELKAGKEKYGLKQKYLTSANDKYHYTPVYKTIGSATSSSGSTASTGSATANCLIRASVAGQKVVTQAFVGRSLEADLSTMIKTGIQATEKYKVVAAVAAACGFSIGWELAKSAMTWIEENAIQNDPSQDDPEGYVAYKAGFDWGPSEVNGSDKVYTIGKPTNSGVQLYIEKDLFERLVIQLNFWHMWDIEPGEYEPLEPVLEQEVEYDFLGRFPAIPQEYVAQAEKLINDQINIPENEGNRPKLDENNNSLIGCAIDRNRRLTITQFATNSWTINTRSEKVNGNGEFQDAEIVYNFRPGILLTFFYQYEIKSTDAMKQYDRDEIWLTTDFIFSRGTGAGEYYDNFGYYRPIEKIGGKIRLGAITDEYNRTVVDPNAVDLRVNSGIETELPNVWAKRIYVSTPDFDQPYRGDSGWPSYAVLNEKLAYLPIIVPNRLPDQNFSQATSFIGDTDPVVLDPLIDNVPSTLPKLGEDPSPVPVKPPQDNPIIPTLPPGVNETGLVNLYKLTKTECQAFHAWLWSFDWSTFSKFMGDPMNGVIGFHAIYTSPTSISNVSSIWVGNAEAAGKTATSIEQFKHLYCGRALVSPFFKNINDIISTKVELFLPFIGFVTIKTSDIITGNDFGNIQGRYLYVDYYIDFMTGACLACVSTRDSLGDDNNYLYQFTGNCAVELPLTAANYATTIKNVLAAATSAVSGNISGAISQGLNALETPVQRSGICGSNAGAMGVKKPYLVVTRTKSYDADNRKHFEGLPQNRNTTLGAMSGYTRVKFINLEGLGATEEEKVDILAKLQEGVFI